MPLDPEKQKARWRRYYAAHPEKHRQRRIAAQHKNAALVDSMKQPCCRCGEADKRVIDFHHVDGTKERSVASMRVAGWATVRIRAEIAKCICLCANCHRIVHWEKQHATE